MQISFDKFFAKNFQFFSQNLCSSLPNVKAFQKAKFHHNLTSGSGSKQRFSLLQEKAVIQAVCLRTQAVSIKGRFWAYREGFGYVGKVRKFQQPQTNTF